MPGKDKNTKSALVGIFPKRLDTVLAEMLACMLEGATTTGMNAVFNQSTTRLAAHITAKSVYADKSGNTWGGRGRKPKWLKAKLDVGAKLEDFLVMK